MIRVVHAPSAPVRPEAHGGDIPTRTSEEKHYLQTIADEVIKRLETLPYGGVVEVRDFEPNPMRTVWYNNSGDRRKIEQNHQSNHDITCLRDKIRRTWTRLHREDWLAIDWPQDDRGTRRLQFNADGKTIHFTIGRNKR